MALIARLLEDKNSGLKIDSEGRRYFRQRKVEFETIRISAEELHGSGWLSFEENINPLDWKHLPSHRDIREFAQLASGRYIEFWYRVFDVAVARSLCGRDNGIFRNDFFHASPLIDLGIPAEQSLSSIPPDLHEKIMREYEKSRLTPETWRIYYLSSYLVDLTADVIKKLKPYSELWDLKNKRTRLLRRPSEILAALKEDTSERPILDRIQEKILAALDLAAAEKLERKLESDFLRNVIHLRRSGQLPSLNTRQMDRIIDSGAFPGIDADTAALYRAVRLPETLFQRARSAATLESSIFRIRLRIARLQYLHRKYERELRPDSLNARIAFYRKQYDEKRAGLDPKNTGRMAEAFQKILPEAGKRGPGNSIYDFYNFLQELESIDAAILGIYEQYAAGRPAPEIPVEDEPAGLTFEKDRYPGAEELVLPDDLEIGNPFHEHAIIAHARDLILKRLRPIRRSAGAYTLVPDHRHGAMTLNPVMKLWKERPNLGSDGPALTRLEINTRQTLECLIRLARLADGHLASRTVRRGAISSIGRKEESVSTMSFFLLPGSCYPLREINRADFPEFRGHVIGESRNPVELGVPPREDAVLTGSWYRKSNHSLYYPIGGDNGQLLRMIWNSTRCPGPPAFFFALGQFVHDTLPDTLAYYRLGEKTFRECVEDYYKAEDRIRKNRDEKTGRRRLDNSRAGVRFMFAVNYSRLLMEILTGTVQSQFRHPATEQWMQKNLELPVLAKTDRDLLRSIRSEARKVIQSYS